MRCNFTFILMKLCHLFLDKDKTSQLSQLASLSSSSGFGLSTSQSIGGNRQVHTKSIVTSSLCYIFHQIPKLVNFRVIFQYFIYSKFPLLFLVTNMLSILIFHCRWKTCSLCCPVRMNLIIC